jgi:L-aspartate oxidase
MTAAMRDRGVDHLYLDARPVGARLIDRFPNIVRTCFAAGIDPRVDLIPISPAAHYSMGGVRTDLDGQTDVTGLYAVGEAASTGVHGANRLASNSLLEGVVFGRRAADAIAQCSDRRAKAPVEMAVSVQKTDARSGKETREWLRAAMVQGAGVVRTGPGLEQLAEGIESAIGQFEIKPVVEDLETANLLQLAAVVTQAAQLRTESRGAHFRSDFPAEDQAWECHQICQRRGSDGELVFGSTPIGP